MIKRPNQIGFSQRVRLEWLEKTANLLLAGMGEAEIQHALQHFLCDKLSVGGTSPRGTREKAITILMKVWVTVPRELQALRADGLRLLQELPHRDQLTIHWGMSIAAYPFVSGIASHVGRLLCLQGTAAAAQVQRRAREKYGERETVSRAARRVLRTFVDWGVLAEGSDRGVYVAGQTLAITQPHLTAWLVEAALYAEENGRASVQALLHSPAFFPFRLEGYSPGIVARADRIELVRHGLDDDMLILRQVTETLSKRT